jgi:hypothetical protein
VAESRGKLLLRALRTWRGVCAIVGIVVAATGITLAFAEVRWGFLLTALGTAFILVANPIWQSLRPPRPPAEPRSMFRREQGEPQSFQRYPYGPLRIRLISGMVVLGVGIVLAISDFPGVGIWDDGGLAFYLGLGAIALGVVALLVVRWMARRGI